MLTGWNGLAIEALAVAGSVLRHPEWIAAAVSAADYLLDHHVLPDRLVRTSIDGVLSPAPATLEDYGMLASGLLHLAEATGEPRFAVSARELVDACLPASPVVEPVETPTAPTFAVPNGPDSTLAAAGLAMQTDPSEGAYPSGITAMSAAAHRLWLLGAGDQYRRAAIAAMSSIASLAEERPMSFGGALGVMSAITAEAGQLLVVGEGPLADHARTAHRSGSVSIAVTEEQARHFEREGFELFAGRSAIDGRPTAYACREFVCTLPVFEVDDFTR